MKPRLMKFSIYKLELCGEELKIILLSRRGLHCLNTQVKRILRETPELKEIQTITLFGFIVSYKPIHGSAHDITGKGITNPLASVLSAALLLDISFGLKAESEAVINAVDKVLKAGFRTLDIADNNTAPGKILGTGAMGEEVLKNI